MSVWSRKTGRAPSLDCRGARVYDHTSKAVHNIEYTPSDLDMKFLNKLPGTLFIIPKTQKPDLDVKKNEQTSFSPHYDYTNRI